MIQRILSLPFIVILMGIGALAMLGPAVFGYFSRDLHDARVFLYASILFFTLTTLIGVASMDSRKHSAARSHLLAMLGAYVLLPVVLAVPFYEAVENTSFLNAYFEMVSSLTTTGATLFDDPNRLSQTEHLWRAIVGWMGGFFIWVTAIAILAPMNLGGFEVTATGRVGHSATDFVQISDRTDASRRLSRSAAQLLPIYLGLTLALWIFLIVAGDSAFVALCHSMSTLSTSGISPVGGLAGGNAGLSGEFLVFIFLFFAISRLTYAPETQSNSLKLLVSDPEFRMGLFCVLVIPAFLFLRHWVGAYEIDEEENILGAVSALWGGIFTVLSFLTTTGFESSDWDAARGWSGLNTPGLIFVGLSIIGGGVATTAGGVKLLRVYALYMHGARELERLVHPSSVGGSGHSARHIRRQGAYMAWIFFMLFALSIAVITAALALNGLSFESSIVLTVASLSTTGPLAGIAAETPLTFAELNDIGKLITGSAMVLGRLETLAFIALLNPDFWRT